MRAGPSRRERSVKRLFQERTIIFVGAGHDDPDGKAMPFDEQASLRPELGAIRGIWASFFPRPTEPWSSRRRRSANASLGLSSRQNPGELESTVPRTGRLRATLEICGRPSSRRRCFLAARSIACPSATGRTSLGTQRGHPSAGGLTFSSAQQGEQGRLPETLHRNRHRSPRPRRRAPQGLRPRLRDSHQARTLQLGQPNQPRTQTHQPGEPNQESRGAKGTADPPMTPEAPRLGLAAHALVSNR